MLLPINIINYLRNVFTSLGFSEVEIKEQVAKTNRSYFMLVLAKIIDYLKEEDRNLLVSKLKDTSNDEEKMATFTSFISQIPQESYQKILEEELDKVVSTLLTPYISNLNDLQRKKFEEISTSLLSK